MGLKPRTPSTKKQPSNSTGMSFSGSNPEAVQIARVTITEILSSVNDQETKRHALTTLSDLCKSPSSINVSNNMIRMGEPSGDTND